jgi:hypothetical protein
LLLHGQRERSNEPPSANNDVLSASEQELPSSTDLSDAGDAIAASQTVQQADR